MAENKAKNKAKEGQKEEWVFVPAGIPAGMAQAVRVGGTRRAAREKIASLFPGRQFFQYTAEEWDRGTVPHNYA